MDSNSFLLNFQVSLAFLAAGIIAHGGIDEVVTGLTDTVTLEWAGFPKKSSWPWWLSPALFGGVTSGAILGALWPLVWAIFMNPVEGMSAALGAIVSDMFKTHVLPTVRRWRETTRSPGEGLLDFYRRVRVPGTTSALLVQPIMIAVVLRIMMHLGDYSLLFICLGTPVFLTLRPLFRGVKLVVVDYWLKLVPEAA